MAGSRKNFIYTDDTGTLYAINLDESNTEAINGENNDVPNGSTLTVALPRNIKPRELFYTSADGNRTIRCVPLTQTVYNAIVANNSIPTISDPLSPLGTGTLSLSRANGERRRVFKGEDSGIDDGDPT